jgi:hypothetical protein
MHLLAIPTIVVAGVLLEDLLGEADGLLLEDAFVHPSLQLREALVDCIEA